MSTITADIEVTVLCFRCGAKLGTKLGTNEEGTIIDVVPCEKCLEEATDKAESAGYDRGWAECEVEGEGGDE